MLGVGIGWLREEFDALGVPFERRGARFDDYVAGMRKIWSGDVVEHDSDFVSWSNFKSYPLPIQSPFPVIMGGVKGKIFQRTAQLGNGWFAPTGDPAELKGHLDNLQRECDAINRDITEIEVTCMWPGVGGNDFLGELECIGVSRVVMPIMGYGDPVERLHSVASEIAGVTRSHVMPRDKKTSVFGLAGLMRTLTLSGCESCGYGPRPPTTAEQR